MKLVVIGDSTSGARLKDCSDDTIGWAEYVNEYLDTTKCISENKCMIGWGIRDFFNRKAKILDLIVSNLKENDILLASFGTLERSPLSRTDFGGFGANVTTTLTVSPNDVYNIYVGNNGSYSVNADGAQNNIPLLLLIYV